MDPMLAEMRITPRNRSFRMLRMRVLRMMENPEQQLSKVIYPAIGTEVGTNGVNVEKALRTAVAKA